MLKLCGFILNQFSNWFIFYSGRFYSGSSWNTLSVQEEFCTCHLLKLHLHFHSREKKHFTVISVDFYFFHHFSWRAAWKFMQSRIHTFVLCGVLLKYTWKVAGVKDQMYLIVGKMLLHAPNWNCTREFTVKKALTLIMWQAMSAQTCISSLFCQ